MTRVPVEAVKKRRWRRALKQRLKRKEIHQLKRLLAEKAMEVDFFKGALQKIEAREAPARTRSGASVGPRIAIRLRRYVASAESA